LTAERQKRDEGDETRGLIALEIAATIVSGCLVALILAVLVWDALHPNASPAFSVTTSPVTVVGDAYRVVATVRNTGDDAAKAVVVHVELVASDSTLAETDLIIDWLPGRSSHEVIGYLLRPKGNEAARVTAAVRGYTAP
jgi:uncharacterized protein (TIGR02588 family)